MDDARKLQAVQSHVREAWASGAIPDLRPLLTPEVLADEKQLLELVAADAEERIARGLPARIEEYRTSIADLDERPEVCKALLMFELVNRPDKHDASVRSSLHERFPSLTDEIDLVVDLYQLVGTEVDADGEAEPGDVLGKYELVHRLGRGTFGEVWQAWDNELARHVALKLLVPTTQLPSLDRVLQEAQASASLAHPNVVAVHAAGRFEDGRCYLDTQLVADSVVASSDRGTIAVGQPLNTIAVRDGALALTPTETAGLMEQTCRGVAAAHAQGITHRDLKPSNILVTPSGVAMVADFGLSTFVTPEESVPEASDLETVSFGSGSSRIVGTPSYMAPEQAQGEGATPLADVYALGATLYFLLSGQHPYRASGRFSDSDCLDVIEQVKHGPPDEIEAATIPAPLASIARKAMAREPEDRYVSAAEMGNDLTAWLERRPTKAHQLSPAGRASLFCSRHLAGVLVSLALTALIIGGTVQYIVEVGHQRDRAVEAEGLAAIRASEAETARAEADAERDRAVAAEQLAVDRAEEAEIARTAEEDQRELAEAARDEAHKEADKAHAVMNFITTMLRSTSPQESGHDVLVREFLDAASARVSEEFADRPEARIVLRGTIGACYSSLGLHKEAEPHLREALETSLELHGQRSEPTAAVRHDLAMLLFDLGRYEDAEREYREVLDVRIEIHGSGSTDAISTLSNLAGARYARGDMDGALTMLTQALALARTYVGPRSETVCTCLNNIGGMHMVLGEYPQAEQFFREAIDLGRELYGNNHARVAAPLNNLARIMARRNDHEAALVLLHESRAIREMVYPENHPAIARSYNNIGVSLSALGRHEEALEYHNRALAVRQVSLPEDHPDLSSSLHNLAHTSWKLERYNEAERYSSEGLAIRRAKYPDGNRVVVISLTTHAQILADSDRLTEGLAAARESVSMGEALLADDHVQLEDARHNLAELLVRTGSYEEAQSVLRVVEATSRGNEQLKRTGRVLSLLATCLIELGQPQEAMLVLREGHALLVEHAGPDHPQTVEAAENLEALHARIQ